MLAGGAAMPRAIISQLQTAGLTPEVEIADVREEFIRVGRQFDPYGDGDPDALYELGRKALDANSALGRNALDANSAVGRNALQRNSAAVPADSATLDRLREVIPGPVGSRQTPKARYRYTPQGLVPVGVE
jgi:hypothetical protein